MRIYKKLSLLSLLSLNLSAIFYVKWRSPTACVVFKRQYFLSFSLAWFLKTIETIETIFFYVKWKRPTACVFFKDNRDNIFLCEMEKANRTYKKLSLLSLLSLNLSASKNGRPYKILLSLNLSQVIPTPAPSHRQGGRRAYSLFSSYQRSASL